MPRGKSNEKGGSVKAVTFAERLGGRELQLDIFSPKNANGAAIVLLHGGALLVGSREDVHGYAAPLMKHGFTVIAASYRLRTEVLWPGPLEDVRDAIAWLRANAVAVGIDPDKIVLQGFSAGAMLSLLSGMEPGVAAVIAFFPPIGVQRDPEHPAFLGTHLSESELAAAAPIDAVVPGFPPTMVLHGASDAMIPVDHALELFSRLRKAGTPCDLRLYHGLVHEFSVEPSLLEPIQDDVALFLMRTVVEPERFAREGRQTNPFLRPGLGISLPAPLRA